MRAIFRGIFCCGWCKGGDDNYGQDDLYLRQIDGIYEREIRRIKDLNRSTFRDTSRKNTSNLKYQKEKIIKVITDDWEKFLNEFGLYRPLLDYLTFKKIEGLLCL